MYNIISNEKVRLIASAGPKIRNVFLSGGERRVSVIVQHLIHARDNDILTKSERRAHRPYYNNIMKRH